MTTDPQITAWLDQEDAHTAQTIRAHGWAVQYVGEGDEPGEPPFGYTIGRFGLGHPELVVVGLDHAAAHGILHRVAALVRDGRDLVPGELLDLGGRAWRLVPEVCPNPGDVVLGANRFYAPAPVLGARPAARLVRRRRLLSLGPRLAVRAGVPAPPGHLDGLTVPRGASPGG